MDEPSRIAATRAETRLGRLLLRSQLTKLIAELLGAVRRVKQRRVFTGLDEGRLFALRDPQRAPHPGDEARPEERAAVSTDEDEV